MRAFFAIDDEQLKKLKAVASKLYTENRMNGDEMRDLGHTITQVVRECEAIPIPEDL